MVNGLLFDDWASYGLIDSQQRRYRFLMNKFPSLRNLDDCELELVDSLFKRNFIRGIELAARKCGQSEEGINELIRRHYGERYAKKEL